MLHLVMTLFIYGVDTESIRCPETCRCVEILLSDSITSETSTSFKGINITNSNPFQHLDAYRNILKSVNAINAEYVPKVIDDIQNFSSDYSLTKKCAKKRKENVRNFFVRNTSKKSGYPAQVSSSKDSRIKRTLKLNLNHTNNTENLSGEVGSSLKSLGENNNKSPKLKAVVEKGLENARRKEAFTYHITCIGLRDLKTLWLRYLPSLTTQLIMQHTFFQSFKAFQQILKESPVKLNHLTVLSMSDSVINQKLDKKYSSKAESTNNKRNPEEIKERKHSEFLPFASLQNPKLRSKADLNFPLIEKHKNLQILNLVNNTITYLPRDTFHPFLNLQILNLSNNLIEVLDNEMFTPLVNLLHLDIHNNRLKSLNEIMFKNLTKLIFLDVSQNLISNIAPSTFQYLISLNILNLASNPLSEKQEAMILLGTGKRLQIVDISQTGLKQIPGTLERSVRVLNLMGNHLWSIRCGDLDSYSLLSFLNLRGNKISYVEDDALGRLELLNNLQISENNLFQIPKSLPNNLEILNLSYNNIQNITNLDFLNLSLLKELSLSYNQVSNIEENAFNNLVHLKILDLSRNPILILPNIYVRVKLTVLNLSYFTNIPGNFSVRYKHFPVQSPTSVQRLYLESSPVLTKIFLQDTKTLKSFTNLEELDLRFTNLTTIRKDVFDLLPKLKILKVEGNPWHCGREILILSNWLKLHGNENENQNEDEVNTAHCSTPSYLYKTTLITLEESNFKDDEINVTNRLTNLKTFGNKIELKTSFALKEPEKLIKVSEIFKKENNNTVETLEVKKVNVKKNNKSSENVKHLFYNKTQNYESENCCGKMKEKLETWFSQKNIKAIISQPDERIFEKGRVNLTESANYSNYGNSKTWHDNSTDFGSDSIKNSLELKSSKVSLRTVKKAESVTAKGELSLKKEYNSHLSFLILSSIGLVVMATLTFTSVYLSRTRRDQSYQRQNQDIEVCSISSFRNELW